jgi:hypothetical protein
MGVATLEDAAEELVVRLKGLDAEIEESRHTLEDLRGGVDHVADDVEREWSVLAQAASSLLEKVREEMAHLGEQAEETARAANDAQQALPRDDGELRAEIAAGRARLDALAQQASGWEPALETLATEAGEAPARSLAERAGEIERELGRLLEEARAFLQDEVASGLAQFTQDVRERGEQVRRWLAEEATAALHDGFGGWEARVDELEAFVEAQAFAASRRNAAEYVEWAVGECAELTGGTLDALRLLGETIEAQLQELAAEVQRGREAVLEPSGTALIADLDGTAGGLASALQALAAVKELLARYTFVRI